jgi:hypothetical protein
VNWLDELERELRAARVPGARRRRIVAEIADHLAYDPAAEERLGEPRALARQFADELGTSLARRAAFLSFLALVPLGLLFAALFALTARHTTNVATGLMLALVVGVQLAFVGGTLAWLRAWRLRAAAVIPAAEAWILLRRAGLGIAGGGIVVVSLHLLVSGRWLGVQWSMPALGWTTVAVGAASVLFGAAVVVRGLRLLPLAEGDAGDFAFDVGVAADPWRLALMIAGAVVLCIALAGLAQSDPIDGLVRALGDGGLCLAGFAVLGRPLGLRS